MAHDLSPLIAAYTRMEPYFDISGTADTGCYIWRPSPSQRRPRMSQRLRKKINPADKCELPMAVSRYMYFIVNPHIDNRHAITMKCANQRCVRYSHMELGPFNSYWADRREERSLQQTHHPQEPLLSGGGV